MFREESAKKRLSAIAKRLSELDSLAMEQAKTVQYHDDETGEPLWNPDGSPRRPDLSFTNDQYFEYTQLADEARRLVGRK